MLQVLAALRFIAFVFNCVDYNVFWDVPKNIYTATMQSLNQSW